MAVVFISPFIWGKKCEVELDATQQMVKYAGIMQDTG